MLGVSALKFAMLSDIHYISRRMVCDPNDSETLIHIATAERALLQAAEEHDTLIITGDLTDEGDRYSHEDLAEFLRGLKARGKKIYVIFATHDFHHHKAFVRMHGDTQAQFKETPWELPYFDTENVRYKDFVKPEYSLLTEQQCTPKLVESCTPEEIWDIYREFGRDQAISSDDGSFSYCVDLDENTRCLMLNDIFRNEEGLYDKSATFTPSCFRWIKTEIEKAKEEGKFIFVCSHHPFMPSVPIHRLGTDNRNMRSPASGHMLADMGINLAFTGHTHVNCVNFLESAKGNLLCNVMTASVRFYPPTYRNIDLEGLGKMLSYETVDVDKADIAIGEDSLREYYYKEFYKEYFKKYTDIKPPFNKILAEGKVGEYLFPLRRKAKLTDAEWTALKNEKLFDFAASAIFNMVTGDGKFTPETPEYRLFMSFAAVADSIIDAQPFYDIRNKAMGGYTVRQTVETLLFKNGIPDNNAVIDFTVKPQSKTKTPDTSSHAGEILMAALCVAAVPLSLLLPVVATVGLPIKTVKKRLKLKKTKTQPLLKY